MFYGASSGVGGYVDLRLAKHSPRFLALDWRGRARACTDFGMVLGKTHWDLILKFHSHTNGPS